MKVVFCTNIDIYKGKFPKNYPVIPRIGEFVKTTDKTLPFDKLQVVNVTYDELGESVEVDLHLSSLQSRQNIEYSMNVYG